MSTTEDRIENLENQVRRQRRWNIALGAVVVVGGLMAAKGIREVPDVIQAKKFEVVNDEGVAVVNLMSLNGGGMIKTCDKNGIPTSLIVCEVDALGRSCGSISTLNGKGRSLVSLGVNASGEGLVITENGKGQALVKIFASKDGGGMVETKNARDQTLVELGATVDGTGLIEIQNGKGGTLVRLGSTASGNGSVSTRNAKGVSLVRITSDSTGSGAVLTQDAAGDPKAVLR
ncbi:hypothetical protein OAG01_00335 [bacterium]|nr:hypothetical protein [bacterium]MDA7668666.1 hypothetical protein [bacterium]MDB4632873.1 hypothetical protein [bacterium]